MINVLYISYDGLTDPLGQSQVLPYLEGLAKEGFSITVLSFEKKEKLAKEGSIIQNKTAASGINWVPLTFTPKPPVLAKIYDRYRMWRKALSLYREHHFQMSHCRSYVSAEVGLRLKKKFGVKMLFDMRGFWADEKIDNGQWNPKHPLYKRIYFHYKQKEKEFLLNADGIISLTKAAKDYLLQQPVYKHLQIDVIPCCADLDHFDYSRISEEEKQSLRASLGIAPEAKIISYVGSFGGWYMTKEMFRFVHLLQQANPNYLFLFLTNEKPERVREEASALGIPADKMIVMYAKRQQLPGYIALSSCSLFFIRNTFSKTASSPTKHAELMGLGIPVVCNTIGDTGNIIESTKSGLLVDNFDDETLANAVAAIPQVEAIEKAAIRKHAKELFDLEKGIKNYTRLYQKINSVPSNPVADSIHA